ncbi:MAG: hypothetical protein U0992_12575 [Planctomycetaceae bacterium]
MRQWQQWIFGAGLVAAGYVLGASGALELRSTGAQDPAAPEVAKETSDKIRAANNALRDAADALRSEGRYEAITQDVNSFLVLGGGGNARLDLESGTGVDPETFAALYAGGAIPEIADHLEFDPDNRLTYNGTIVRMYSKARLQRMQAERTKLAEAKQ